MSNCGAVLFAVTVFGSPLGPTLPLCLGYPFATLGRLGTCA